MTKKEFIWIWIFISLWAPAAPPRSIFQVCALFLPCGCTAKLSCQPLQAHFKENACVEFLDLSLSESGPVCFPSEHWHTLMTVKMGVLPMSTSLWKGGCAELICTDVSIIFHGLFPAFLASSGFPISHAPSGPRAIYGMNLHSPFMKPSVWRGKMTLWACSSPSKKDFSSSSNYKFLGFLFGPPSLSPFSTFDFC